MNDFQSRLLWGRRLTTEVVEAQKGNKPKKRPGRGRGVWRACTCHLCASKSQDCFNRLSKMAFASSPPGVCLRSSAAVWPGETAGPGWSSASLVLWSPSACAHRGLSTDSDSCERESRHCPSTERLFGRAGSRRRGGEASSEGLRSRSQSCYPTPYSRSTTLHPRQSQLIPVQNNFLERRKHQESCLSDIRGSSRTTSGRPEGQRNRRNWVAHLLLYLRLSN